MKTKTTKILSIIALALLAFAAVLGSCKHNNTGTFTGSDKQPLNITIAQNEMIKFEKTNEAGRTIVAEPFSAKTDLTFYLWGTAQSGQTLAPKTVTVTSTDGVIGKVVLDIDCYNWSLTLAACETADLTETPLSENPTENDILPRAVLIGYGNVDMMFTNQIKFTLTPKGLSKTGGANLTLQLADGMVIPNGYQATAYIYDIITGAKIAGDTLVQALTFSDATPPTPSTASYTKTNIAPGTYSFQVEFTKPVGADGIQELRKYVWNDTIIILPGKTVEKTIIIPNLVGVKPATPENFTVTFNKAMGTSDVVNEAEESKYPGYYTAHFTWDGSGVTTEMNFALEIAEVADDLATASGANKDDFEAIFGTDPAADPDPTKANAKYSFNYLNDIRSDTRFYRGGSLFANSDYVDVYLELGKRYIARLYSENNAGYSNTAAYLKINCVEDDTDTLDTINRYRVHYYNQGGVWNDGSCNKEAEPAENYLDKIVYWSQNDASHKYAVLNPVKDADTGLGTEANPYLYQGPADWIYWITDLTTGTKYPDATGATYAPDPYADFKNLDLYASYSREGNIEIYNDATYDILSAWVTGFGLTAGNVSLTTTNQVSKATLPVDPNDTENKLTTVTVTVPAETTPAGTWKYDKVSFKITYAGRTYYNQEQVGAARASANTFSIPLKNLPTGYVYNCLITARYQMTTVSYPFTVYLTD
ncbi:MAG: hypothetical protein J5726_09045 [Treponema sp.]|nr:hypothetical protein [Treponema sp.]